MEQQAISPIQQDAFKALVADFTGRLVHSQTFADLFRKTMEDKMDVLADTLAERVIEELAENIDCDDVARNSVSALEEKLSEHVSDLVQNLEIG